MSSLPFPQTAQTCNLLAVADEDGYVGLYDTRRRLPSSSSSLDKSGRFRTSYYWSIRLHSQFI
jgi:denticleless